VDRSWFIVGSLVVASFTLSHVMARLPRVDEADRAISESIGGLGGVSVQRIPDKMQRPCLVSRNGMLESPVNAMSSWSTSMSGFGGPVGWRETASAALC
jgi:hypothetical protein